MLFYPPIVNTCNAYISIQHVVHIKLRNLCKRSKMINIYTDPITRRKPLQPFWCGNVENMDRFTTEVNYWLYIPVYHRNQSSGHAPFGVYL